MESYLKPITKWLQDLSLVVNKNKTKIYLFYKYYLRPVTVRVDDTKIMTKNVINVLRIQFDSKLLLSPQVTGAVNKAKKALNAITIIQRFFNSKESLQVLTSNLYSILYYTCDILDAEYIKPVRYKTVTNCLVKCIKTCLHYPRLIYSYLNMQIITNRATSKMFINVGTIALQNILGTITPLQMDLAESQSMFHNQTNTL
jgi:hypothetical protein